MPFRQQEPVVPRVLHQPAAGLHQPLLETRERPALDPRRQDQPAPEVAQVVGPDAQLQAHFVQSAPPARGATHLVRERAAVIQVSIRAPRAGGDAYAEGHVRP